MAGDNVTSAPQALPAPGGSKAGAREGAQSAGLHRAACGVCALLVPAVCVALAVNLKDAEPELSVSSIWAPDQGGYYEDKEYANAVFDDPKVAKWTGGYATGFFTSYPKSGGTHMTKESLLELIDRQKAVESVTVEYNGNAFTYQDVCYGQLQEGVYLGYTLPCLKFTAVHAYREGGYEMDVIPQANEMWYNDVLVPGFVKPLINYFFLSLDFPPYLDSTTAPLFGLPDTSVCIPAGHLCDLAVSQDASNKAYCCLVECADVCAASWTQAVSALDPTVFQGDADCMTCMTHGQRSLYEGLEDAVVTGFLSMADMPYTGTTTSDKDDWMYSLALGGVKGQLAQLGISFTTDDDCIAWILDNLGISKQAKDNSFTADAPDLGLVKGARSIEASNITDADLHAWASEDVYGWAFRVYPRQLVMGRTTPDILEYDTASPLTSVLALKATYFFEAAQTFKAKVASPYRAQGPGGHAPVNISVDDALEVVGRFKEKMEEAWNLDEGSDDLNKYHSFTEAYRGTFWRGLKRFTEGSVVPSALSYLAVIVVSVLLMSSCQLTESKMMVSMIGASFSVVAFSGALGIIVMGGSRVMVSSAWTLPFLLVGLGVDDMYVILTTLTREGGNTAGGYFRAMTKCWVPITMTSLTNAGMFAMLMLIEVPAVREVGKIAVLAIGLQYLVMVTAFPCVCYFDMVRVESSRLDCFCCLKGRRGTSLKNNIYSMVFKPILGSSMGRVAVLLLTLALVGAGAYGSTTSETGLDLKDFFQPGTVEYEYFNTQDTYFDASWPVTVNFGKLEYTDPEVQLHMLQIYESLIATQYMTKVPSDTLWTASLAAWGTVDCMRVGRAERCGYDAKFDCKATWVENTRGLKLQTAPSKDGPGVCKLGSDIAVLPGETSPYDNNTEYCPVFQWNETKLASCIVSWQTEGVSSVSTGTPRDVADDTTVLLPIMASSSSGGSYLFNVNIRGSEGYVDCIKATRKYCDDDTTNGMHCWLQGTSYDYWEQYLDLYVTFGRVVGLAAAAGFLISFGFLMCSFVNDSSLKASFVGKICAALCGSLIIMVICLMSVGTVFGISSLAGVPFSVLSLTGYLTAIGFSVEFAVHIIHRFMTAPQGPAGQRVEHAMELLSLPMGCGFIASAAGLLFMLSSDIQMVRRIFFIPLITVQVVTFFLGTCFLPSLLHMIPCPCLSIGPDESTQGPPENSLPDACIGTDDSFS